MTNNRVRFSYHKKVVFIIHHMLNDFFHFNVLIIISTSFHNAFPTQTSSCSSHPPRLLLTSKGNPTVQYSNQMRINRVKAHILLCNTAKKQTKNQIKQDQRKVIKEVYNPLLVSSCLAANISHILRFDVLNRLSHPTRRRPRWCR